MSAPDFEATLAASAIATPTPTGRVTGDEARSLAKRQLSRPASALCTSCGGTGSVGEPGYVHYGIPEPGSYEQCPDCPTIARLLAIGAAVWSGDLAEYGVGSGNLICDLQDALRYGVRP